MKTDIKLELGRAFPLLSLVDILSPAGTLIASHL